MDIQIDRAIKQFFPSSSLQMVFFEAIANAFDANAEKIDIDIYIKNLSSPESLTIKIKDDGIGFSDDNYNKFSSLLNSSDKEHKGLGRLVYLIYFSKVNIESTYGTNKRQFVFDRHFQGMSCQPIPIDHVSHGTELSFFDYTLDRISDQKYLQPSALAQNIIYEFLPRLYLRKLEGKLFEINLNLSTESSKKNPLTSEKVKIDINSLPILKKEEFKDDDLFAKKELFYQIEKLDNNTQGVALFAYCIDGRSYRIPKFESVKVPGTYRIIFLLKSELLDNAIDSSRTKLELKDDVKRRFERFMVEQATQKIAEAIPSVNKENQKITEKLRSKFPHLIGFLPEGAIGLVDENDSIEFAQNQFFMAQKDILNASSLTEEQYKLALQQASRVLAEYILYRNFTIERLQKLDYRSDEAKFHNIIVPMQQEFRATDFSQHLFVNNAWILDDKYMNYSCVLSDENMNDLLREIKIDSEKIDALRPDIAIVFSQDITSTDAKGVDVVIVELKKKDNDLLQDSVIITQLRQRARRLLQYYGGKIQRIWYYGIVGFSTEFRNEIRSQWTRLYSNGDLYYQEIREWPPDNTDESNPGIPVGYFLNSYDAICKDAKARNEAFLNVLRASIQSSMQTVSEKIRNTN